MSPDGRVVNAVGMDSAHFTRCAFNAGTVAFNNGYLDDCDDNDVRSSTFLGEGRRDQLRWGFGRQPHAVSPDPT